MKWNMLAAIVFLCFVGLMVAGCGSQKQIEPQVRATGSYGAIILDGPPFDNIGPVQVTVLGDVTSPGTYSYQGLKALPEIIALAGGPTPDADLTNITIIPLDRYHSAKIIDLERLLQEPRPFVLTLKNGDTIFIPAKAKQGSTN